MTDDKPKYHFDYEREAGEVFFRGLRLRGIVSAPFPPDEPDEDDDD